MSASITAMSWPLAFAMTVSVVTASAACAGRSGSRSASLSPTVAAVRECPPGRADCDGDPANGCETDTTTDVDNCHVCGMSCRAAHSTMGCFTGVCRVIACEPGYGDCDRHAENGCEAELCYTSQGYKCAATCGGYGF